MPLVFAASQEAFKWMLLNHQTGASVVCTHRELKRKDVVCILYGASLPVVPRKRHGRVLLERGMHMFKRVMKGQTQPRRTGHTQPVTGSTGGKTIVDEETTALYHRDKLSNELDLKLPEGVVKAPSP